MKHISYILTQAAALAALESAGVKPDRTDTRELPGGRAHEKPLPPLDVRLNRVENRHGELLAVVISVGSGVTEGHEVVDLTQSEPNTAGLDPAATSDESVLTVMKPAKVKKAK